MESLDIGNTNIYYLDGRNQQQKISYIKNSDQITHTKEKYYMIDNKSTYIIEKNNDILVMYKVISIIIIILFSMNGLYLIDNYFL